MTEQQRTNLALVAFLVLVTAGVAAVAIVLITNPTAL